MKKALFAIFAAAALVFGIILVYPAAHEKLRRWRIDCKLKKLRELER
jgi:hypothetical protein